MSGPALSTPRLVSLMSAAQVAGYSGYVVLPFITGVLIEDVGLAPASAGTLGSLEVGTMAVTALFMAPRTVKLPLGIVALVGASIAAAAHAAAALADSFAAFAVLRIVAGLGEGLLVSVTGPLLAMAVVPERTSALTAMVGAVAYAVILSVVPLALAEAGRPGLFLALAGFVLLTLPLLLRIPRVRLRGPNRDTPELGPFPRTAPVFALLASGVLIGIGESGVWSLDQRFASRVGLGEQELGALLGFAGILSLAGAGVVAWLGARVGRLAPLVFSVGLLGISHYVTVTAEIALVFIVSICVESFILFIILPLIYGIAIALDDAGRVATALGGAMLVGRGLGPGLAGTALDQFSYQPLGIAAMILSLLALTGFVFADRRAPSRARRDAR